MNPLWLSLGGVFIASVLSVSRPAFAQTASASYDFEGAEGFAPGTLDQQPSLSDAGVRWVVNRVYYDQGITAAAAHSGTQSFRVSNATFDTTVNAILSPFLSAPAGEPGSTDALGRSPGLDIRRSLLRFWARRVKTSTDEGLGVSFSINNGNGARLAVVSLDERDGGLAAVYEKINTLGMSDFVPITTQLPWGEWFTVEIDLRFVDGPDNDPVRVTLSPGDGGAPYAIFDATSSESLYWPSVCAGSQVLIRLSHNNRGFMPQGVFVDELQFDSLVWSPDGWPDAGSDAGAQGDAGLSDAGSGDAGAGVDAGSAQDAGSASDAGSADDAGAIADAGPVIDAGAASETDAGTADAGPVEEERDAWQLKVGSGCSASSGLGLAALALGLLRLVQGARRPSVEDGSFPGRSKR